MSKYLPPRVEWFMGIYACLYAIVAIGISIGDAKISSAAYASTAEPLSALGQSNHAAPSSRAERKLTVNPQNRAESARFYTEVYANLTNVPIEWTGNHHSCDAGTTSAAFRAAVAQRINYFRAMAGLPTVTLDAEYSRKAQAAALIVSANNRLTHEPSSDALCYTPEGAEASGRSNLFLGTFSVNAIDGYIADPGEGNYFVGHRRWILNPRTQFMGTGDIPAVDGFRPANALWVHDGKARPERPETRDGFVAWPPHGFVPHQLLYPRWSFSYPEADFSNATVSMTQAGATISLEQQKPESGYGEETLVWQPEIVAASAETNHNRQDTMGEDTTYTVTIRNVVINGQVQEFAYWVTGFEPAPPPVLTKKVYLPFVLR